MFFGLHSINLELQISPVDLFSVLSEHCENAFLLESSEGVEKLSRFSFLGFSPGKKIALKNSVLNINGQESEAKKPVVALKNEISKSEIKASGFLGGAVGYFSFDYIRYIEQLNSALKDEVNFPDFEFGLFNDAIIFDHKENRIR